MKLTAEVVIVKRPPVTFASKAELRQSFSTSKVITLVGSNQRNYFENANAWSKRALKTTVTTQHTNERLLEHVLYKIYDEIWFQESKVIWRWSKKELPISLHDILLENNSTEQRSRQFQRYIAWKSHSISFRLATRAINEINELSKFYTRNNLKNNLKEYKRNGYIGDCRIRNCFICARAN